MKKYDPSEDRRRQRMAEHALDLFVFSAFIMLLIAAVFFLATLIYLVMGSEWFGDFVGTIILGPALLLATIFVYPADLLVKAMRAWWKAAKNLYLDLISCYKYRSR